MPAIRKPVPVLAPIAPRRGRRRRNEHLHLPRREGTYRLPLHIGNELESMLRDTGNPEASWRLAMLLALTWTRPACFGAPFVIDRRALNGLLALRLTEDQLRGAIKTLLKVGFIVRAGGGQFDRERQRNRAALYQFDPHFAALFRARLERRKRRICKSPTPGLRPIQKRFGGNEKPTPNRLRIEAPKRIGIPPAASQPNANLEAALERLKRAIGRAGGG
jgi:hypothetical protein